MKSICITKNVTLGATILSPPREMEIPGDISLKDAEILVKGGWAVDADKTKAPEPEKEAAIVSEIEKAKTKPEVDEAVAQAERPTEGILDAAAKKVKSFIKRPPYKKPGRKAGE